MMSSIALQQPITSAVAATIGLSALLIGCCSATDIVNINVYVICGHNYDNVHLAVVIMQFGDNKMAITNISLMLCKIFFLKV